MAPESRQADLIAASPAMPGGLGGCAAQQEDWAALPTPPCLPVAYLEFEGERHGFRRAENTRRVLEGELYFLSRIFGFQPADDLEPVEIENL